MAGRVLAVGTVAMFGAMALADDEYVYDDGTAESALNYALEGDIAWMNWFAVQPGKDKITRIRISMSGMPAGVPFTACVWWDPNGFEDPFAASLLTSADSVTEALPPNQFMVIDVPDVVVKKGIFVGVVMHNDPDLSPAAFDKTSVHDHHSWYMAGDPILPDDLFGGGAYPWKLETIITGGGDWLIRADAESSCPADFNSDGEADILDFVAFQASFVGGDVRADCNGDGALNILDFVCFQGLFQAGCP